MELEYYNQYTEYVEYYRRTVAIIIRRQRSCCSCCNVFVKIIYKYILLHARYVRITRTPLDSLARDFSLVHTLTQLARGQREEHKM